jgi:hypothetical protein
MLGPEMEFLDIKLAKDSSLLLHAIHRKIIHFSGFKNPYKICETTKLDSINEYSIFVE